MELQDNGDGPCAKIAVELEDSKTNLKELESKLSAINQMYADLKK